MCGNSNSDPECENPDPWIPLGGGNGGSGRGGGNGGGGNGGSPCSEDDDLCWMNLNNDDDNDVIDNGKDDWDGRCDRWHRTNCLPWPDPFPSAAPDYISLNVCVAVIFIFGFCGQLVRDYYNNWYWGVGPGATSVLSYSLNGGWLLQAGRSEEATQNFIRRWSVFGAVTSATPHPLAGLGGAATWGDPSLTRPFDYHDVGLEVQGGNFGGSAGILYDFWIYDSGDPTPWWFQDKDGVDHINLQK